MGWAAGGPGGWSCSQTQAWGQEYLSRVSQVAERVTLEGRWLDGWSGDRGVPSPGLRRRPAPGLHCHPLSR